MVALSKVHATCAHLDTHHTLAVFDGRERVELGRVTDVIHILAKAKAFDFMKRRSQKVAFTNADFVNAEARFYNNELDYEKGKMRFK